MKKPLLAAFAMVAALMLFSTSGASLPTGSCLPNPCPEGFMDGGVSCADGTCTRMCVTGECSDTFTTVYTSSVDMDDEDIEDLYEESTDIELGEFEPLNNEKCYRFRQTTPDNFISSSDIEDEEDTHDFDSAITIHWVSGSGRWYDNQNYYCNGDEGILVPSSGAVWVDSCGDDGNDFDSADDFENTNYLYCAPNENACKSFNENCDTDCYGQRTGLEMVFNANVENSFECNNFVDYCNSGSGDDLGEPVIEDINFKHHTVDMYVDEYDLVNKEYANRQCEYWPECNPSDACCSSDGLFRPSGHVCKDAHDVQCTDAGGCGGIAHEDRCTGASSACPDNNFEIDYDKACDDATCVEQSCSGSTLQPQRACSAGACQQQATYACPYNLGCMDAKTCKTAAVAQDDCGSEATYDTDLGICYVKGGDEYNLSYDENGNLVDGLGIDYVYDSFNQLVAVKDSATGLLKEEYTYDHSGNRRKKATRNDDGSITTVYYVSDSFIQIVNSTGVYNETYYYANGKLVGKKGTDQGMLFFHPDHLGSTRLVTDSSANVVADLSYKPFGEIIDNTNERFLYTGKELDSSGNYYLGARYLNPAPLYTFTQPDQNIPNIYNPQDMNRYSYARNNPYTYVDPTGESPTVVTALVGAGLGALVGGGVNLAVQLYNSGGHISQVDVSQFLIASAAGAVAGGITGASLGLLGPQAIAAVGPEVFLGTTGSVSGVGAQTTVNLMIGQEVTTNFDTAGYYGYLSGLLSGFVGGIFSSKGSSTQSIKPQSLNSKDPIIYLEYGPGSIRLREPGKAPLMRVDRAQHGILPKNHLQYGGTHGLHVEGESGDVAYDILAEVYRKNPNIEIKGLK